MNTIVCLEPWGGVGISTRDTGFGNRILHWAISYHISTLLKDCELLVQEEYWPELEFISLPKTKVTTISTEEVKEKFLELSSSHILHILNSNDVSSIQNSKHIVWYSEKCVLFNIDVSKDTVILIENMISTGIKNIKFKEKKIDDFFKDTFSDFSSIHLRRGLGTSPSLGFIEWHSSYNIKFLINYLRDFHFTECDRPHGVGNYLIIPDIIYFSIIEDIISKNKNNKIYISSDISEEYYPYYIEKYPDNVVSRNQYIDEFLNLFKYDETKVKTYKYSLKQTLINLFDIFALSYSKTLIIDECSTWGKVAFLMGTEKVKIDIPQYILDKEGISFNTFVVKYKFIACTPRTT